MKSYCLVCLVSLLTSNICAQVPEISSVDTINLSIKQTLPFDRPFILRFQGPNAKSIYSAFLFEWIVNGNSRTLKPGKYTHVPPGNVLVTKDGADLYVPAQPPNKNFAFLITHRFDGDLLDEVLQASWLLYEKKTTEAGKILKGLSAKVESQVKNVPSIPASALEGISAFAYEWANPDNAVLDANKNVLLGASIEKGYSSLHTKTLAPLYANITLDLNTPDSLTNTNLASVVQAVSSAKLSISEFGPLASILSRGLEKSLMDGTAALQKELTASLVKNYQLPARLKNLNASLDGIDMLREYCELIQAQLDNKHLGQLIKDLKSLYEVTEKNRDILKKVTKGVLEKIAEDVNLVYNTWAFGHNEVWDLKTRGSYRLIPDIGVATIVAYGNEKNATIVRPYIGASFYFRPVDKSVPFKYFEKRHRWLQRLSANIGVTLGKTEEGEFSDFFNSMNLLVGANYKITRELAFSAGIAFLKRKNANHAIEDKTTTVNPYLALSFDLDFTSWVQKLTGKFSL